MAIFDDQHHDGESVGTLSYLLIALEEGALEAEKSQCKLMGLKMKLSSG